MAPITVITVKSNHQQSESEITIKSLISEFSIQADFEQFLIVRWKDYIGESYGVMRRLLTSEEMKYKNYTRELMQVVDLMQEDEEEGMLER